jgi:hypothetical protein
MPAMGYCCQGSELLLPLPLHSHHIGKYITYKLNVTMICMFHCALFLQDGQLRQPISYIRVWVRPKISRSVGQIFITVRPLRIFLYGAPSLTRGRVCFLQCTIYNIFYCLRFETPPTWRTRSLYLYPPGTGWPGYTPRHWVSSLLFPSTWPHHISEVYVNWMMATRLPVQIPNVNWI